jgi:hypothetical protein
MIATATSQSTSWDDRGRLAALSAVGLTAAIAVYVFVTFQNRSPLVPFFGSLLALFGNSERSAVALRVVALVIVFLFAGIGMASIGIFYIPALVALVVAVARTSAARLD